MSQDSGRAAREPAINLPPVIVATLLVLAAIHIVRVYVLNDDQAGWLIAAFAFVPIRLTGGDTAGFYWPGGEAGNIWTFASYAFLHADWMHLVVNGLWLTAFGTPVARRFGPLRFVLFSLAGAAAGALGHLALFPHDAAPLVGASAAISAQFAAAARFTLAPGGRLGGGRPTPDADFRPAVSMVEMLTSSRILMFLGAWLVFNVLFGLFFTPPGVSGAVAWEAHLGGFLFGLLLFPLFDSVRRPAPP